MHSFHSFHLQSRDPSQYRFLANSDCYTADGVDDKADYKIVVSAMKGLGFSSTLQQSIWRTIAAILHLGQLKQSKTKGQGGRVTFESSEPLKCAAELLGVEEAALGLALVTRSVQAGGRVRVICVFLCRRHRSFNVV